MVLEMKKILFTGVSGQPRISVVVKSSPLYKWGELGYREGHTLPCPRCPSTLSLRFYHYSSCPPPCPGQGIPALTAWVLILETERVAGRDQEGSALDFRSTDVSCFPQRLSGRWEVTTLPPVSIGAPATMHLEPERSGFKCHLQYLPAPPHF